MERPVFVVQQGVLRLPPGFRFHPTDEELVLQYLKKKIFSSPLPASVISEIDLGKYNPWDLPGVLEGGDKYFFTQKEAKMRGRPKGAAGMGFWKVTGKDKPVMASGQVVGMKKVMVFYRGRPRHAARTDWIMHEYSLQINSMLNVRDWVVCRVFKKKVHGGIMAQQANLIGVVNLGPSPASSCVTDLSEGSSDGDEGNSNTM